MAMTNESQRGAAQRAIGTVLDVLPRSVRTDVSTRDTGADLIVGSHRLQIKWVGEGSLGNVRRFIENWPSHPDVVAARRLSPGAREALSAAGIGWVDETGAAEIAIGSIVVSRTGHPPKRVERTKRWTLSMTAIAEVVLCGTKPTVAATAAATGLSIATCTNSLKVFADLGLLEARAARGRWSARRLTDPELFLSAYVAAVDSMPAKISLPVGVTWRDPVAELIKVGREWDKANLDWASTGAAAASVIGPYLTTVTTVEVYIEAETMPGLEASASVAGFRPIEGGRLTLRPFPTVAVQRLATETSGLRVAPWPRVYVDLRHSGVRGEEAAEHLRDVISAG